MKGELSREEWVMARYREMFAGPELDALVAGKVMGTEVKPYSTQEECTADVMLELNQRGYLVSFDNDDGVVCTLKKDAIPILTVWGLTYEEAICRAALKLFGSDPA
jgi:hypothetical protein